MLDFSTQGADILRVMLEDRVLSMLLDLAFGEDQNWTNFYHCIARYILGSKNAPACV